MGAKEVLIKAIIQSIPMLAMAVFKIPKNICKVITDEQRRMHWSAWWRMCSPKKEGEMGFRAFLFQLFLAFQKNKQAI